MVTIEDTLSSGLIVSLGGSITVRDKSGKHYSGWLKKSHETIHSDKTNALALGDEVDFSIRENVAVIYRIKPHHSVLIRQSTHKSRKNQVIASNLDQAMVIIAKNYPETPMGMIDRMLIATQSGGIRPLLLINKDDEAEDLHPEILTIYPPLGIPVHCVSAKTGKGIDELRRRLTGKKTIFLGLSGVGKTSLVRALTGIDLRVNHLNVAAKTGKHTTTHSCLYELEENTFVADIPGLKQLGFLDLESVISFYPEIHQFSTYCKFRSCTHTQEPGCAVQLAIQQGHIHPKRFASYQKLMQEQIPFWE